MKASNMARLNSSTSALPLGRPAAAAGSAGGGAGSGLRAAGCSCCWRCANLAAHWGRWMCRLRAHRHAGRGGAFGGGVRCGGSLWVQEHRKSVWISTMQAPCC